jgi:2-polyprenyl-3-methyl-5-hydroxy-6-metoxy-1,4-benzoquinol methylase
VNINEIKIKNNTKQLLKILIFRPDTILDIGFGNGYLLRRLAKQNLFVLLQEKVKIHKADIGVNDYGRKIRKNMVG